MHLLRIPQLLDEVFKDIIITHQLQSIFRIGQLPVNIGGIEQIERSLVIYLQHLRQSYYYTALLSPKY